MGWVRLDDEFFLHPKVADLPNEAILLHFSAMCLTCKQDKDGKLTDGMVKVAAGMVGVSAKHKDALVDARLWDVVPDGGYEVHNYLDYNPTAAQKREQAEKNRERVAEWRKGKRNKPGNTGGNGVTPPVTDDVRTPERTPDVTGANPVSGFGSYKSSSTNGGCAPTDDDDGPVTDEQRAYTLAVGDLERWKTAGRDEVRNPEAWVAANAKDRLAKHDFEPHIYEPRQSTVGRGYQTDVAVVVPPPFEHDDTPPNHDLGLAHLRAIKASRGELRDVGQEAG